MIGLLIRVLIAISIHNACNIGVRTDYYAWVNAHPDYMVAWSFESPIWGDYWIMSADSKYYLFKFKQPIAETIGSGQDHGECFNEVQ